MNNPPTESSIKVFEITTAVKIIVSFSYTVLVIVLICRRSRKNRALRNYPTPDAFSHVSWKPGWVFCTMRKNLLRYLVYLDSFSYFDVLPCVLVFYNWMCSSNFLFKLVLILKQYLSFAFVKRRLKTNWLRDAECSTIIFLRLMHIFIIHIVT